MKRRGKKELLKAFPYALDVEFEVPAAVKIKRLLHATNNSFRTEPQVSFWIHNERKKLKVKVQMRETRFRGMYIPFLENTLMPKKCLLLKILLKF